MMRINLNNHFICQGIFLGIYGGSIVDANNERVEKQKKNVKKKMLENMDSSFRETKTEEVTGKEPSLLHDMFDVLVLEGPILIVVLVCGLLLGYFEGWTLLERFVTVVKRRLKNFRFLVSLDRACNSNFVHGFKKAFIGLSLLARQLVLEITAPRYLAFVPLPLSFFLFRWLCLVNFLDAWLECTLNVRLSWPKRNSWSIR